MPVQSRRLKIIDLMIGNPELSIKELGEEVGLSKSRVSVITNDPTFKWALERRQTANSKRVDDIRVDLDTKIKTATERAIDASVEIINGTIKDDTVPLITKQASIAEILKQGHAKAIEKSAHMDVDVPIEMIRELLAASKEVLRPITPVKQLEKIKEDENYSVDTEFRTT